MDTNTVVVSAAIGAIAATVITLTVHKAQKVKDAKEHASEVLEAAGRGRIQGWFEGRESVLQNFQNTVEPAHFTDR
jgi:hypothetical protein